MSMGRVFFLLAVILSGCLTASQRREEDLNLNARLFNDDMRWARWEQMASTMPAEERRPFLARVDLVKDDLVLGDFEVKNINYARGSQAATVTVEIEWYKKSDPVVSHATLEQRWEAHSGHWIMMKQRRTRGDRFPLVTEPAGTAGESKP